MKYTLTISILFTLVSLMGQTPSNNSCYEAINLTNTDNWCSDIEAFTTINATQSDTSKPFCFPQGDLYDVWFSFIAIGNTASVTINGRSGNPFAGTLLNPQIAIYTGACFDLQEIECNSDGAGVNVVERFASNLIPGQQYWIRVTARNGYTGTFQLCFNNFFSPPEPDGDCITGVVLCDKSSFSIPLVFGEGNDPFEMNNNTCNLPFGCDPEEASSSWYKWTCSRAGTLTFTITPNSPVDDIDFIVYELPNGLDDCTNKRNLLCMFSGETINAPLAEWQRCMGPTGLRDGDPDVVEPCGCIDLSQNNFLAPLDMELGKSYALAINNFSETGNGWSIDFGGTGEFLGPMADFDVIYQDSVCLFDTIQVINTSQDNGDPIISWSWNFSTGANPISSTNEGPHEVTYDFAGPKAISLVIESSRGCRVAKAEQFTVHCCELPERADAGPDQTIDLGCFTHLQGSYTLPGDTVHTIWTPLIAMDDPTILDPEVNPYTDQEYFFYAIDNLGCYAKDNVTVFVNPLRPIYIPNAFSPNSDGINDGFTAYTTTQVICTPPAMRILKMQIFNRWGDMVADIRDFPLNDETLGWDGEAINQGLSPGVFVYMMEIEFIDGYIGQYAGDVTLLK